MTHGVAIRSDTIYVFTWPLVAPNGCPFCIAMRPVDCHTLYLAACVLLGPICDVCPSEASRPFSPNHQALDIFAAVQASESFAGGALLV
jgi:hypothetical protein